MQQVFVGPEQRQGDLIDIRGEDAHHLSRVVRLRAGEELRVSVAGQGDFFGHVLSVEKDILQVRLVEEAKSTELDAKISLLQALPKGDRMETIVEKCVELGAYEIRPIETRYCVVKWDEKKRAKRLERWQNIAKSAAQQSKRSLIPEILPVMAFAEAVEALEEFDLILLPYENARGMEVTAEALVTLREAKRIAIIIGPEGGFAEEEVDFVQKRWPATRVISLGRRILRTDTAAITAMAMAMLSCEK